MVDYCHDKELKKNLNIVTDKQQQKRKQNKKH